MSKEKFIYNDVGQSYKEHWASDILPQLKEKLPNRHVMDMPILSALSVHIRINSTHTKDKSYVQAVEKDLTSLTGQKSIMIKAKKSVAGFKIREGQLSSAKVTLRRGKMKSFLAVLRDVVIPSIRDFRGLPKNFDARGGYNLTVFNHDIFPGIDVNDVKNIFKVQVSFVIKNARSAEDGFALLSAHGMPFTKKREVV